MTMTEGLSFGGVCAWTWRNFMRAHGNYKLMEELLVALGDIVKACFKLSFKLHQNSFFLLLI
jgi:hypothetical protein